jgi:hypothetical protein
MRVFAAASLICGGLLVAACGGEADVAPAVDVANTPAPALESAAEGARATASLVLGCGAPFTRGATPLRWRRCLAGRM